MQAKHIYTSPPYEKSFSKLPEEIKRAAKKQLRLFSENPFHPSLDTHTLSGRLA